MNIQEQEEWDFCPANECQNAYALSQMERKPDDGRAIDELLSHGRYVLVMFREDYCRFTDAFLGTNRMMLGDYETSEEAEEAQAKYPDDSDIAICAPRRATVTVIVNSDEELPF